MANGERKYFCNASMRFNMESMLTKMMNFRDDYIDGIDIEPFEVAGKTVSNETIFEIVDWLEELYCKSSGRVTGKEYGQIKKIQQTRQMMRYQKCLSSGMSERDAGYAFTD